MHCLQLIVLLSVNIALLSIAGYRVWSFADPIGAIVISMYIIGSWAVAGWGKFVHVSVHVVRHLLLIGGVHSNSIAFRMLATEKFT